VAAYTVGGMNVLKSWFKYRKADPGGRRSSPLDDIVAEEWTNEWSHELVEVLTVLHRLVALEPAQEALLAEIVDGPKLTREYLAAKGVRWPTLTDRRPLRPDLPEEGMLPRAE
jgi:hypothetical protein